MLKRVLLLPLLSPVLATLVVGAVNPKPPVTVRVLTWTSPALPLGLWLAGASCLGAGLSAAGAALALQGGRPEILPRRSVRRRADEELWDEEPAPRARRNAEPRGDWGAEEDAEPAAPWAGPSRGVAEPAPTVSVPFRVIRRGQQGASEEPARESATATAEVMSTADPDDWGSSGSEEW